MHPLQPVYRSCQVLHAAMAQTSLCIITPRVSAASLITLDRSVLSLHILLFDKHRIQLLFYEFIVAYLAM
jgi:hypothetical protein